MKRHLIIAFLIVCPGWLWAQFSAEHSAMNNLRKGKWEKAKNQLTKSIRKDSLNPSANFALSVYFFTSANPDFQIDSAYRYVIRSLADYQLATSKQRDRLRKVPLDSVILIQQRERIDSAGFARALTVNTEDGYISFLKKFSTAKECTRAMELRDEVAYLNAMKENTYQTFLQYLEKYPQSARAEEAKVRYEKLLFEAKTADRKLASYESFLLEYPETFHRKEAEKEIFELATASGEIQQFEKFLKKYPQSSQAGTARRILYHLLKDGDQPIPELLMTDSIKVLQELEKFYLVPFFKDDLFGFMNERGTEIIKPIIAQMNEDYLCGNVTDELLIFGNLILARNGTIIYSGDIKDVEQIGSGFLKITTSKGVKVLHHSGFSIDGLFQDAIVLGKNYLVLKNDTHWGILTLSGRMLLDFVWDDIQQFEDVLVLKKNGKFRLVKLAEVSKLADQLSVPYSQEFDDVKNWPRGMVWVRKGREQGVLNQNLTEWIKIEHHEVSPTFFGAIGQSPLGYKLYSFTSSPSQNFIHIKINQPRVAVQYNGYWQLLDPVSKQFESVALDTISFSGPFPIGVKNDSSYVYIANKTILKFHQASRIQFIPGRDSLFFLMVEEGDRRNLYDTKGNLLFPVVFDKIEYNNEGFFTVLKKDKRGLVSIHGRIMLPPEYDAVGTVNKGIVQVLKEKKFGLIDLVYRKEIKPEYDKNVMSYNASHSIVFKTGLCGLFDWDNKPVLPIEFEEITYWNDSSALVKKNFNWMIYNFVEKRIEVDKIKNFRWVNDSGHEKIMIAQQDNNMGVISNKTGTIIPFAFTDIVNLGSVSTPMYFTEKHVEEASLYVVIYYNNLGKQLKRQVFEINDYEKIYCSGN